MSEAIKALIDISHKYGKNPEYILAGGGNTSYKDDRKIWIKASGTTLADIDENGFVCLDREKVGIISVKNYSSDTTKRELEVKNDLNKAILYPKDKRPSVEISLHELIDFPFVVHTHPTLANGLLCGRNSENLAKEIFGTDVLYIPYADPGYILFKEIQLALDKFRAGKGFEPNIILLENHGVFVGAESPVEIEEHYTNIETLLKSRIKPIPMGVNTSKKLSLDAIAENIIQHFEGENLACQSYADELIDSFVASSSKFQKISVPFTPDNIVYCKSQFLFIEEAEDVPAQILDYKNTYGYYPKIILIKELGLIAMEENEKVAQIVLKVYHDMVKISYISENFGGPRPLTKAQIDYIENWEAESYRRKVSTQ